ncbi:hypothetical protein BJV82DRAFT_62007 [Fennellomyces sp. T-0311]|nr:hypothetical protein BJV82DRAFT_62007 [Fennellomyces sp. T-0311]
MDWLQKQQIALRSTKTKAEEMSTRYSPETDSERVRYDSVNQKKTGRNTSQKNTEWRRVEVSSLIDLRFKHAVCPVSRQQFPIHCPNMPGGCCIWALGLALRRPRKQQRFHL